MKALHRVAIVTALFVSACATSRPAAEWVRTNDAAPAYEQARQICEKKAMEESSAKAGGSSYGMAAKAAAGEYTKCMRELGWEQRKVTSE